MTIFSKKQQAALASRKLNREYVSRHGGGTFAFEAPAFDSLNDDGLIPASASKENLTISFEAPTPDVDFKEAELHLVMRAKGLTNWGEPLEEWVYEGRGNLIRPDDIVTFDIPSSLLHEGQHEIAYILYESSLPTTSRVAPLAIDETAPYKFRLPTSNPRAPSFPADLGEEIDEDYISDHDRGLVCTFPDYPDYGRAEGDTITYYFSRYTSVQFATPIDTTPVTDNLEFVIPWDQIRVLKAGEYFLFYILTDLAGNKSSESFPTDIRVNVVGVPDPLQARVPLALPGDGLIDLQDAYEPGGVIVEIREYNNVREDIDIIDLTWGGESAGRFNVRDYTPFPLRLPVDSDIIFKVYDEGTGETDTDIEYRVDRNGADYDAPPLTIKVDLSSPGPSPTPDPENSQLNRVLVYGSDPDLENELPSEDFGKEATVEIVLWDNPPPMPGIIITGYWGSFADSFGPMVLTDEGPGDTVTLTVPWATIKKVRNGTVPVFYTLSWPVNDNFQRSRSQDVVVNADRIVMEQPTFVKAGANLTCTDLNRADLSASVRVPGNRVYFEEGAIVRLEWQVCSDQAGQMPVGDPVPFESEPLTSDMVVSGFPVTIKPYDTVIRPAGRNSVRIQYFVTIDGAEQPSNIGITRTVFANQNTPPLYCEDLVLFGEDEE
jgi:hypothetical protein